MSHKRVLWVDIGMAVAAVIGIVIVVFLHDAEFIVPLTSGYILALLAWAVIAEIAAVRAEEAESRVPRSVESRTGLRTHKPLSH